MEIPLTRQTKKESEKMEIKVSKKKPLALKECNNSINVKFHFKNV